MMRPITKCGSRKSTSSGKRNMRRRVNVCLHLDCEYDIYV